MKVIMPFINLTDFYYYRYENQLRAIAENVDKLYIPYLNGHRPDRIDNILFMKIKKNMKFPLWKRAIRKSSSTLTGQNLLYLQMERDKIINVLPRIDYDVVYFMSGSPLRQLVYVKLAEKLDIPVIMRLRGNGKFERKLHINNWIKRKLYDLIDSYSLSKCDLIIPIKEEFKTEFEERGLRNIGEVVPIGVDTNKFMISNLPRKLTVGYAGRISKEKGIDFLFEVMDKTPEIEYHLAGMKNIKLDKFPSNVIYHGVLKHESMSRFYDRCSIIALPSDIEGLSNTLLESYSKCRPVIMTKEAHPLDIPVFGFEVDKNIDLWVNILDTLTNDKIKELGLKARIWLIKENMTWQGFGEKLTKEFSETIENKTDWSTKVKYLQSKWTRTPEIPEYRQRMIELISDLLEKNPKWKLIDLGSGTGLLYRYLPDKFKDRYFGIDLTREMVEYCIQEFQTDKWMQGSLLIPEQIPSGNILVTQNVIQHNTLWQYAMKNIIDKAKDMVIFCERTQREPTEIIGYNPTRWRFRIEDFKEAMRYCANDQWLEPQIKGHPKSTEGLENVLTIFQMRKRK